MEISTEKFEKPLYENPNENVLTLYSKQEFPSVSIKKLLNQQASKFQYFTLTKRRFHTK